jgi:exonuclease 1
VQWNLQWTSLLESVYGSLYSFSELTRCRFVDFAMHRVRMLQHFGAVPFLVFDGDYLPSKAATEADRRKRREESKRLGFELLNAGKASQAYLELQKAIDVTPEMARQLIDELRKSGIQYIVAPYEADAQLVYLERKGLISGILSEDSDMLVFGAKCLLTKLDQYGNCIEINKADFCSCREINLTGWSDKEFRQMAILSGCDYLNSVNNMGLKTAYRMVRKHKTIEKVIRMLQFDGKFHVPKGYLEAFNEAELTFLHQWVYCPLVNSLVFHTQPSQPIDEQSMPFIGAYIEPDIARRVATGDLNPVTKQPILVERADVVSIARSPWVASRPQPRRAVTSDDLKKGVSIEQFFKPKRVPLAELDPNCFTPSPSQQNALLRNPDSWLVDPVPRPYLRRSNTEDTPPPPQSAPTRTGGRTIPWTRPVSETRPAKRTRLCADDSIISTPGVVAKVEIGRSRFFDSPMTDPSPSVGRSTKAKASKKGDIEIFSDDSIEEALLSLPDCDGWHTIKPKNKKPIAIYDDEAPKAESEEQSMLDSAIDEIQGSKTGDVSQITAPSLTQSPSILSSGDEPSTPVETPIPQVFNRLKEEFAFISPADLTARQPFHTVATPPSSVKQSRIPRAIKRPVPALSAAKTFKPSMMTPLQSLGTKALNRASALPPTPPYTPVSISTLRCMKSKLGPPIKPISPKGVPFPEVARPSRLKQALKPAEIPLPASTTDEEVALARDAVSGVDIENPNTAIKTVGGKGSEDLIIHDSEEEPDEAISLLSPLQPSGGVSKLSLEKFVFQG